MNLTTSQTKANNYLSQIVAYQNVDFKYKRAHLELEQRQYFTLQKLLETTVDTTNRSIESLAAIVKNTALPEFQKIEMNESVREQLRDNFAQKTSEKVTDFSRNYFKTMLGNVGNLAKEKNQEIRDTISMVSDLLSGALDQVEMMDDGQELSDEEKKKKAVNQVVGMLGELGLSKVSDKAARKFLDYASKSDRFMAVNQNLRYLSDNKGRIIEDFIKDNESALGARGYLAKGLSAIAPKFNSHREVVGNNLKEKSLAPITWNMQDRHTLNEIIPGWFSKLDHTLRVLTYGEGQEAETYDYNSERFTTISKAGRNTASKLINHDTKKSVSDQGDLLIQTIDPKNQLSQRARSELKKILIKNVNHKSGFSLRDFSEYTDVYTGVDGKIVNELIDFFNAEFEGDFDSFKSSNVETAKRKNAVSTQYRRLSDTLPNIQEMLNEVNRLGTKSQLRELGLLKGDKVDEFNYDEYYRLLLGGQYQGSPRLGNKARKFNRPTYSSNNQTYQEELLNDVRVMEGHEDQKISIWVRLAQDNLDHLTPKDREETKNTEFQTGVLQGLKEIHAVLATQYVSGASTKEEYRHRGDVLNSLLTRVGTTGRSTLSGLGTVAGNIGSLGLASVTLPTKLLTKGINSLSSKIDSTFYSDIKDKFNRTLLSAKELKENAYYDGVTGKLIKSIKDIKGEVKDSEGNIVISAEQFNKGLTTRNPLGSNLIKLGGKLLTAPMLPATLLSKGVGAGLSVGGELIDKGKGLFKRAQDLYVGNESTPRLLKVVMENGGYFDARTGEVVKRLEDIKGDIVDANGDLILSAKEMTQGLFDKYGRNIDLSGLIRRFTSKAFNLVKTPLSVLGNLGKGFKESINTQLAKALLLKLPDNVILQTQHVSMLTGNDKVAGDTDGDGLRDGGWRAYLNREKKVRKDNQDSKGVSKTKPSNFMGDILSKLTDGLGS